MSVNIKKQTCNKYFIINSRGLKISPVKFLFKSIKVSVNKQMKTANKE